MTVRLHYPWVIFSGTGARGGISDVVADSLLSSPSNLTDTATLLRTQYEAREGTKISAYYAFARRQQRAELDKNSSHNKGGIFTLVPPVVPSEWPLHAVHTPMSLTTAPSRKVVKSYFFNLYNIIEPVLLHDLLNRSPGEHCSSDGTFRLAKFCSEVKGPTICYHLRHFVLSFHLLLTHSTSVGCFRAKS